MASLQELEAQLSQMMGGSPNAAPVSAEPMLSEEDKVKASMQMEQEFGRFLKSQMDREGNLRPQWAQGQSEETALSESAIDPEDRLKLSFLGTKDRIAKKLQASGQFEEVKMNKLDQLVVKKDGLWHQYDPDASAWDTTKALLSGGIAKAIGQDLTTAEREAWSDMADVAPELALTAAMTGIGAAAGAGFLGAGAAAAATGKAALGAQAAFAGASGIASKGVATVLGRAIDAYTPEPSELLSDTLLEGALMAAGVPVAAGLKFVGGQAKNALSAGFSKLKESSVASTLGKKLLAMSGNTTDDVVEVVIKNSERVNGKFSQLVGLTDDQARAKLLTEQSDEIVGVVDDLLLAEKNFRDKARSTLISAVPDEAVFKPADVTDDFLRGLKDNGLITVKAKDSGLELSKELIDRGIEQHGSNFWNKVKLEPTLGTDRMLARANPASAAALEGMTSSDARLIREQLNPILRLVQGGDLKGKSGAKILLSKIEQTRRTLGGKWRQELSEGATDLGKQLFEGFDNAVNAGFDRKFGAAKPWQEYTKKIASLNSPDGGPGLILNKIRNGGYSQVQKKEFATQLAKDIANPGQRIGAGLKNEGIEDAMRFFEKEGFKDLSSSLSKRIENIKVLEGVRAFSPRITKQVGSKALMTASASGGAAATLAGIGAPSIATMAFPASMAASALGSSPRLGFQTMRAGQHFASIARPQVQAASQFMLNTLNGLKNMGNKAASKVLRNEAVTRAIEAQLAGRLAGEIVD